MMDRLLPEVPWNLLSSMERALEEERCFADLFDDSLIPRRRHGHDWNAAQDAWDLCGTGYLGYWDRKFFEQDLPRAIGDSVLPWSRYRGDENEMWEHVYAKVRRFNCFKEVPWNNLIEPENSFDSSRMISPIIRHRLRKVFAERGLLEVRKIKDLGPQGDPHFRPLKNGLTITVSYESTDFFSCG